MCTRIRSNIIDQYELRLENDVPDILFPTDNQWGIPTLSPLLQAEYVVQPILGWGTRARRGGYACSGGTWHFYVDDYRFNRLWKYPEDLVRTGARYAVEPNYTVSLNSPRAYVEWCVYRKRWMARYWQTRGIRIWVDLNVPTEFSDLLFAGVPHEWRSFITRGYCDRMAATENEYLAACNHHGNDDITFVVYGGGKAVREYCQTRNWQWLPEQQDVERGKYSG